MEKLVLRSVMYGADKIPDSWFEKVPGGFYKDKQAADKAAKNGSKNGSKSGSKNGSRPGTSGSGSGGSSGRSRRHSTGEGSQGGPPRDNEQGNGRRSGEQRRRHDGDRDRPQRSSYDGNDDVYYSGDDRHRRRNHGSSRRQRSFDNDDRYGYQDGYGRPPRDPQYDDRRTNGRQPYPEGDFGPAPRHPPNHYAPPMAAAAAGAAAGADATGAAPYSQTNPISPTPLSTQPGQPSANGRSGVAAGYVPYADIYGAPSQPNPRQPFSPPPLSNTGSVQPNDMNRVSPVAPQGYHQNPYAQDVAAAAAAGAGAAYGGHPGYQAQDYGYEDGYDPRYDHRYDDRYNGYDDHGRPYPLSPPSRGPYAGPDDLRSYDSYDARDNGPPRRARSERRQAYEDPKRAKSQGGRGKSRLQEHFDTSQRGLGYGAVGALAGGLVGSEVGKGPIPMAIGAAIGALGANAFEARERYVPTGYDSPSSQQQESGMKPVDPRKPLNAQLRGQGGSSAGPSQARRREDQRHAQYAEDGTYAKRDSRRGSGYYSD